MVNGSQDDVFLRLIPLSSSTDTTTKSFSLRHLLASTHGEHDSRRAKGNGYSAGIILGRKGHDARGDDHNGEFTSPIISRRHAQINMDTKGHLFLTDLGSLHGTEITPSSPLLQAIKLPRRPQPIRLKPHTPVQVCDGDVIMLGKTVQYKRYDYGPLPVRVEFRYPELGRPCEVDGKRSTIADSILASIDDLDRLHAVVQDTETWRALQKRSDSDRTLSDEQDDDDHETLQSVPGNTSQLEMHPHPSFDEVPALPITPTSAISHIVERSCGYGIPPSFLDQSDEEIELPRFSAEPRSDGPKASDVDDDDVDAVGDHATRDPAYGRWYSYSSDVEETPDGRASPLLNDGRTDQDDGLEDIKPEEAESQGPPTGGQAFLVDAVCDVKLEKVDVNRLGDPQTPVRADTPDIATSLNLIPSVKSSGGRGRGGRLNVNHLSQLLSEQDVLIKDAALTFSHRSTSVPIRPTSGLPHPLTPRQERVQSPRPDSCEPPNRDQISRSPPTFIKDEHRDFEEDENDGYNEDEEDKFVEGEDDDVHEDEEEDGGLHQMNVEHDEEDEEVVGSQEEDDGEIVGHHQEDEEEMMSCHEEEEEEGFEEENGMEAEEEYEEEPTSEADGSDGQYDEDSEEVSEEGEDDYGESDAATTSASEDEEEFADLPARLDPTPPIISVVEIAVTANASSNADVKELDTATAPALPDTSFGTETEQSPSTPVSVHGCASSDTSSPGPVTPPTSSRKRALPDGFNEVAEADETVVMNQSRPIKKARRLASTLGLVVLGAALGSVGTIAGLMQIAD